MVLDESMYTSISSKSLCQIPSDLRINNFDSYFICLYMNFIEVFNMFSNFNVDYFLILPCFLLKQYSVITWFTVVVRKWNDEICCQLAINAVSVFLNVINCLLELIFQGISISVLNVMQNILQ